MAEWEHRHHCNLHGGEYWHIHTDNPGPHILRMPHHHGEKPCDDSRKERDSKEGEREE